MLLIGAGGHARVCLEALLDNPRLDVVGAVSSDRIGVPDLGVLVLGSDDEAAAIADRHGASAVFVAIGDNTVREAVAARSHLTLVNAVSRFSMVSRSAELGEGVALLPGSIVNANTAIGSRTIVNTGASVDHDCVIGETVHIAPGVAIGGGVQIGDRAFVGLGARVIPGISIGADAVVGAGAVVIRDVPAGAVVVGVPARVLRGNDS